MANARSQVQQQRLHSKGLAFSFNWRKDESQALSGKVSLQQRLTVFNETIKRHCQLILPVKSNALALENFHKKSEK